MAKQHKMIHIAHALMYREQAPSVGQGAALAKLRHDIAQTAPSVAFFDRSSALFSRLMSVSIPDMPPSVDDVSLLVDILAFRLGATSRADAWRAIGMNPNGARNLLTGDRARNVTWPVWKTLRDAALAGDFE